MRLEDGGDHLDGCSAFVDAALRQPIFFDSGKQIVAGTEDQPPGAETEAQAEEPPAPEDPDQPEPGEDQPRDTP